MLDKYPTKTFQEKKKIHEPYNVFVFKKEPNLNNERVHHKKKHRPIPSVFLPYLKSISCTIFYSRRDGVPGKLHTFITGPCLLMSYLIN